MASLSTKKLLVVAALGAVTLFLGIVVVAMQLFVLQHHRRRLHTKNPLQQNTKPPKMTTKTTTTTTTKTVHPSVPLKESEIQLWKQYMDLSNDPVTAAKAYWNQALPALQTWDATLVNQDQIGKFHAVNETHALLSLLQASKAGHADAQFYTANAYSTGIWPIASNPDSSVPQLHVLQDMELILGFDHDETQQLIQAQLLYRMAAMDGNVDATVAMAYRVKQQAFLEDSCRSALPYYEAAANGVMDQLETSPQHRGKIVPPMDKHVLAQVHLHGGTSSQLHYHNKPDESPEAIQYYHLRATMVPDPDTGAAYTLGHLYHYGSRGVPQNMTLALQYYEIAADKNHAEAAGQAGKFHFWALGMPYQDRDLTKAHRYFRLGAPFGIEECTERWKLSKKQKENSNQVQICDHPSLNGLGLVHLFGIPHMIPVDYNLARRYFKLSKQMGNMDAMYNLAMMNLGWKENFVYDHAQTQEQADQPTTTDAYGNPITKINPLKQGGYKKPYKGPSKTAYQHAMTDLTTAATMGHVQARHRLGLMYAHGVVLENLNGNNKDHHAVVKDCPRAMNYLTQVIDAGSLSTSQRTRRAYKQYMAGNYQDALRNYMAAAETGHETSQVNAAFLLERGTCLQLSRLDCARASVRLWKAAAQQGNAEACLRVGDFYYYGRLRQDEHKHENGSHENDLFPVMGPFSWLHYFVFPERLMPHVQTRIQQTIHLVQSKLLHLEEPTSSSEPSSQEAPPVCDEQSEDGTCAAQGTSEEKHRKEKNPVTSDLAMAAHYYRMAAEQHKSPRANFNLGFMHEWGLGLSQDFPLAKRHYDLASAPNSQLREAEVPVQIALLLLNWHESIVKLSAAWEEWWNSNDATNQQEKVNNIDKAEINAMDVILSHMMSWESFIIVVLTIVLSILVQHRRTRPQDRIQPQ